MKTFSITLIVLFWGALAAASGPSTHDVALEGTGTAGGYTDSVTCEKAKAAALIDAENSFVGSEYTYEFSCNPDHMGREIEVTDSVCKCNQVSDQELPLSCTYTGTFICWETVWHN